MPNKQIQSLTVAGETYDIVDNTSGYALLASPAFTGTPTAPTPTSGDDSTKIATTAFVQDAMSSAGAGTITKVKTTAGAHTTIDVSSGAAEFNVPTKTSHLTNDSGYVTTDNKVEQELLSDSNVGRAVLLSYNSDTGATNKTYMSTNLAFADSASSLRIGAINSSYRLLLTASNAGGIQFYNGSYYVNVRPSSLTSNAFIDLPNTTGTLALTSDIPTVPSATGSNTTGISIADHTTGSITGVQSSTTTASKVTLGTAISVPNVTAVGSGSFTQGAFDGGSFTQGTDSFTANTPTAIDTSKFNGGSFTSGTFTTGSLTMVMDTTDAKQLNITFTAPTHGADSFTSASLASGFYSAGTAASFTQGTDSFTPATHGADSHTHTAPTLGTAISIPNVTGATDVTVPIKNTSSTTVVTGKTHTITDNGHTHDLG